MKALYNCIDTGILTARNIDVPKMVKYKPRKRKRKEPEINFICREGVPIKISLNI